MTILSVDLFLIDLGMNFIPCDSLEIHIARQGFAINGFIKHYPDILIMTQSGKLICAETKGEHLKNDDSREKIALGQAWSSHAGSQFRYYMVFQEENDILKGAVSMRRFVEIVAAL